ncbi:hypothetical protein AGABI1DRAFT_95680 [Agaricus bisporus var. burnettii JB137-S8]|uniref:Uncharacterized protein n=1 Tax=Agaricus bisporus var. burnettii (strain JB137-S8 / ATCC MYA-4627 / FGSC 10392) TaxID=597362 RepID=K5WGI1_AGABU|nr:uncharacterized protein AGABI1DRAFT_95680 [Agaricus bisporus var. burnettii JB137-S8]EKM74381.1 hypothetical protein AGABI1DRAFT_95680 [Agaricus bisporus var. burnettii JB137-S8]
MSIIVMSALKGNRGKVFMDHCIDNVLHMFALFPLKEVVVFHRLQLDMGPISLTTLIRLGKVDAMAYRAVASDLPPELYNLTSSFLPRIMRNKCNGGERRQLLEWNLGRADGSWRIAVLEKPWMLQQ